jgi:hypothetical protein
LAVCYEHDRYSISQGCPIAMRTLYTQECAKVDVIKP